MKRAHSIVHMCVMRSCHDPGVVRWYVRHVWYRGGATRDQVLAQGTFEVELGGRAARDVVLTALRQALAEMELSQP